MVATGDATRGCATASGPDRSRSARLCPSTSSISRYASTPPSGSPVSRSRTPGSHADGPTGPWHAPPPTSRTERRIGGQRRRKHLHRNRPTQNLVLGPPDLRHPTPADQLTQREVVAQAYPGSQRHAHQSAGRRPTTSPRTSNAPAKIATAGALGWSGRLRWRGASGSDRIDRRRWRGGGHGMSVGVG